MLNIEKTKREFEELKVHEADKYDGNASKHYTEQLRKWVLEVMPTLLDAADHGLKLSRIAAASERNNQPQFLDTLFEEVVQVQSLVCDGRTLMQRERPMF